MSEPRLCIVGAGALSSRRIYPYIGAAGARLVGVCDLDVSKAERNARLFGGRVYADMDTMLDVERPDGVIVCIGPEQHAALAPRILRRKIAVYTEKPPAPTAAQALAVARVAHETGVLCMTGFKKRYAAVYDRAHRWINGFPPQARYALAIHYASGHYANDSPRNSFLLDFALHAIDLAGYLFGDVERVFAFAKDRDAYAVSVRFACGAVGSLSLNCGRSFTIPTEDVDITLRGGNFMIARNSSSWRICEDNQPREWREPPTFASAGDSGYDTGHLAELAAFVHAVQGGGEVKSAIYESYKSMVFYEAVAASAASQTPVDVRYEPL